MLIVRYMVILSAGSEPPRSHPRELTSSLIPHCVIIILLAGASLPPAPPGPPAGPRLAG
jgi:hypothetical protein